MYNKSNQYQTIFDSYNEEIAATNIQLLKVENASNTYNLRSKIKYDIDNKDHKYLLWAQFAEFNCNGCTIAPLTGHENNEVYQELVRQEKISSKFWWKTIFRFETKQRLYWLTRKTITRW